MKKTILLFIVLIVAFNMSAQERPVMHTIIFADTDDGKIGKGEMVSLNKFRDLMQTVSNAINFELVIEPYLHTGSLCRNAELLDLLDEFNCDTNDIVVFCYLGHGVRSYNESSSFSGEDTLFPQMCLHESDQSKYYPLINVANNLASHRAKLTVVIGDCCNMPHDWVMPKEPVIEPTASTKIPSATISLFKDLFLNTSGVITICATKPGTYGWSNQVTGSYFLNALIQAIENTPINSVKPGNPWGTIMDIVMKDLWTKEFTLKSDPTKKHKMTPCYKKEPRKEKTKPYVDIVPPRINNLQQLISDVANASLNDSERIEKKQKLLLQLAPSALIRTVSSDGSVAFNSPYRAGDYLDRILKLRDIININIKNIQKDSSGKITLLEVHEVYKINQ